MTAAAIPVLPDSAPFTAAQRAWLNGFFAGLVSRGAAPTTESAINSIPNSDAADESDEMPWHDPAIALDERLKLAEGKSKPRVLMAAMAQLDCGACGYICQTYAEAIASGEEKDLTRCAPGGRDTAKKLKELLAVVPAGNVTVNSAKPAKPATPARPTVAARLLKNQPLNSIHSSKDTRLISFDLHNSGLTYNAGDALGVIPENCPDLVGLVLEAIDASGGETVAAPDGSSITLHEALLRHYNITTPPAELVELMAQIATDPQHTASLKKLADEGTPEGMEILDLLRLHPSAIPETQKFAATLTAIRPRLYSISSSQRMFPDEVHLTVGVVRYVNRWERQCKGVASTYLADRLRAGQKARIFIQHAHGFAPPVDGNVPMIMVGPGTGIAPFRAFLQGRAASGAQGRNWLFFGDQKQEHDFLYREEIEQWLMDGTLHRLDTAFSRDQEKKVYVQTRMLEKARDIWAWLEEGAHFYVCGDAKRMAKDVDDALKKIVAEQGKMSPEQAAAYVAEMSKSKRYARDVY